MTTDQGNGAPAKSTSGLVAYGALIALVIGLAVGALADHLATAPHDALLRAANIVGGLWLNGLKMTVIPLMVALLITGVAHGAEAAQAGKIAARTIAWIVVVCTLSAVFGALMMVLLTDVFPLSASAAQALRAGVAAVDPTATKGPMPGIADFFTGIVPSNVFASATNGDVLPLVVFSLLFALAAARLPAAQRRVLANFFEAVAAALIVIIGWVLWIAPLGVLALAFTVGATAGSAAFAGVLHYVLLISTIGVLVTLAGYPLAILAGRVSPGPFAKAMMAPTAVAISTRSSLASLPAMLTAAREIKVKEEVADVSLPLAVALFRGTGPAMNVGVAIYVAHWLGIEPSIGQFIAAVAVAAVVSYGAVSLPGEITFIGSIATICMALGVPVAPLALLVAVEMVPDIFRTVGNVTLDVAVTVAADRWTKSASSS